MDGLLNYKSNKLSLKDVDVKNRIVTGYLSSFDNKDHDGDIIVKGAFSKSITERKNQIFFLNQHNWQQPHGKFNILKEDSKGLYFESEPLINTSYSDDTLKLYEAGIVAEHSVGFQTIQKSFEGDTRILKELKLFEGSNVTLGANSDTPFTGFKNLTLQETNDKVKLILKAFRNGTFTDETFSLLEISLKQLQLNAFELGKKESQIIVKPSDDTLKDNAADIIKNYTTSLKTK